MKPESHKEHQMPIPMRRLTPPARLPKVVRHCASDDLNFRWAKEQPINRNMSAEPKERPLHELLSRDMVDIYVGPDNTHWILHEKLLCHRSRFFRNIFYKPRKNNNGGGKTRDHAYGLPDEDDASFKLFVGWLYAERLPTPREETELGPLFDVYLMAEKWEIPRLVLEVLDAVRRFYAATDSWPSLRRVQYVYAHTAADSAMRRLLVQCVARMLLVGDGMPAHWEKALRKNGQLAVDVIVCVQGWRFEPEHVPDARIADAEAHVSAVQEKKAAMDQGAGEEAEEAEDAEQLDWGSGWSRSQTEAASEKTS